MVVLHGLLLLYLYVILDGVKGGQEGKGHNLHTYGQGQDLD